MKINRRMRDYVVVMIVFVIMMSAIVLIEYLLLGAAIHEQEFQDNIRAARCERMNEHDRAYMRGYCQ